MGLSIHYKGSLKNAKDLQFLIEEVVDEVVEEDTSKCIDRILLKNLN